MTDFIEPGLDILFTLQNAFHSWLMQVGFSFLQAGTNRVKHLPGILFNSLLAYTLTAFCWFTLGYAFSFGEDSSHFLGSTLFLGIGLERSDYVHWYNSYTYCAISTSIIFGAAAERISYIGFIVIIIINASFINPVVVHWVWHHEGWLYLLGFHDLAGGGPVHLIGGTMAFIAARMVGPRIGAFDSKLKEQFQACNTHFQVLGVLILWFSWFSFNTGSLLKITGNKNSTTSGLIAINTLLAGCSGGLCVFFYNYSTTTSKVKDSTIHIGMGIIAGLTSVTSSADVVQPWAILIIGVIGGFVYILTCKIMKRIKVDDPLDAVSIHAGCGIWGLFQVGLFDVNTGLFYGHGFHQLGIQILGIVSIMTICCVICIPFLYILQKKNLIRFSQDIEVRGTDIDQLQLQGPSKKKFNISLPQLVIKQQQQTDNKIMANDQEIQDLNSNKELNTYNYNISNNYVIEK